MERRPNKDNKYLRIEKVLTVRDFKPNIRFHLYETKCQCIRQNNTYGNTKVTVIIITLINKTSVQKMLELLKEKSTCFKRKRKLIDQERKLDVTFIS